jgi:succinyl-CoA synthetase alpha subunit
MTQSRAVGILSLLEIGKSRLGGRDVDGRQGLDVLHLFLADDVTVTILFMSGSCFGV